MFIWPSVFHPCLPHLYSYSQNLCSCCLLTTWKCVPLLDLLLCARRNCLPPTPNTLHFGCSYCLYPSLSALGAVILNKKGLDVVQSYPLCKMCLTNTMQASSAVLGWLRDGWHSSILINKSSDIVLLSCCCHTFCHHVEVSILPQIELVIIHIQWLHYGSGIQQFFYVILTLQVLHELLLEWWIDLLLAAWVLMHLASSKHNIANYRIHHGS